MTNWGFIIGVGRRIASLDRLEAAVNDAQDIKKALIDDFGFSEEKVILLLDPKKNQILDVIVHMKEWEVANDDQLLVFFAGHGRVKKSKSDVTWFLVPADGNSSRRDKRGIDYWDYKSFISLEEFLGINEAFKGKHVFYIFDSCHSGVAVQAPSRGKQKSCSILVAGTSRERVVDAAPGEKHSILTATILNALKGWGALNETLHPEFSAADLRDFVRGLGTREAGRLIRARVPLLKMASPFGTDVHTIGGELFMFRPQSERLPWQVLHLLTSRLTSDRKEGLLRLARINEKALRQLRNLAFEKVLREEESSEVVATALQSLDLTWHPTLANITYDKLRSIHPVVVRAAIHAIVDLSVRDPATKERTIKKLNRLLKRQDVEGLRLLIDESLARLDDPGGTRRIYQRMKMVGAGSSLRARGLSALQPTPRLITQLLSDLNPSKSAEYEEWRGRRAAADALGYFGIGRAQESLMNRVTDPNEHWLVRLASVEALGQIGDRIDHRVANELSNILFLDDSLNVRTATAECLGVVPNGMGETADALVAALSNDLEWRVRRAAAEALAMLGGAGILDGLISALTDPHFRVRREAALAIGQLALHEQDSGEEGKRSERALQELRQRDLSEPVRRAAAEALERLRRT
jgi:HEAT repeat protein